MISSRGGFFSGYRVLRKNPDLWDKNPRVIPKIKKIPKLFWILGPGFSNPVKNEKNLDRKSAEFGIRDPKNPILKPTVISRPTWRYLNVNQFFENQRYFF